MTEPHRPRVKYVIGPDGSPLTIADLPAPGTKRWVIRRKAEVVAAVRGGLLSLEEACSRYTLTVELVGTPRFQVAAPFASKVVLPSTIAVLPTKVSAWVDCAVCCSDTSVVS